MMNQKANERLILENDKERDIIARAMSHAEVKQDMSGSLHKGPQVKIVIRIPTRDLSSHLRNSLGVWLAVDHKMPVQNNVDNLELIVASLPANRQSFGRKYKTPASYVHSAEIMLDFLRDETKRITILENTQAHEKNRLNSQ
jgi:hypothetical protein